MKPKVTKTTKVLSTPKGVAKKVTYTKKPKGKKGC